MTTRPTAPRTNLPTRCSRLRAALSYSITRWLPRTNLRSRTTMCSSSRRRHRSALPLTRYARQPPGADSSFLSCRPKISPVPGGWQQTVHPPGIFQPTLHLSVSWQQTNPRARLLTASPSPGLASVCRAPTGTPRPTHTRPSPTRSPSGRSHRRQSSEPTAHHHHTSHGTLSVAWSGSTLIPAACSPT